MNPLVSVDSIIRVIELIYRSFSFTEVSICSNSSIMNWGEFSVQEGDGEDKDESDQ